MDEVIRLVSAERGNGGNRQRLVILLTDRSLKKLTFIWLISYPQISFKLRRAPSIHVLMFTNLLITLLIIPLIDLTNT